MYKSDIVLETFQQITLCFASEASLILEDQKISLNLCRKRLNIGISSNWVIFFFQPTLKIEYKTEIQQ